MKKNTKIFLLGLLAIIILSSFISALPAGPVITYVSNSTASAIVSNRSVDEKGTITVITLTSTQQDYKWKAYVGNVSGKLALDDGTSYTIYDWTLGTPTGEVYVTRASSVTWANVSCVNQSVVDSEQTAVGMTSYSQDSINSTFNYTTHKSFLVGTKNITSSSCRSTATYINDTIQTIDENAFFQEILLKDDISDNLIYATMIEDNNQGYDNNNYDFQLIVAENESASVPLNYYFYVELG